MAEPRAEGSSILAQAREEAFGRPLPRKVPGPLVDVHVHARRFPETAFLFEAAARYGVEKLVTIGNLEDALWVKARYPGVAEPAVILDYEHRDDPARFARVNRDLLERARDAGIRIVKFWFKPEFYDRTGLRLDDPRMEPIFEFMAGAGMAALVHIADPDIWFAKRYRDVARYGTKEEQYPQLERCCQRYRSVPFQAAHLGGDPEHLDHLERLLAAHPNLYLDTSATRWLVRELGGQKEAARAFFSRHAGRILFGTDQVVTQGSDLERYTVRYWIHQVFWETGLEMDLPIDDPDAEGTPRIVGLDLPGAVLEKVYRDNARKVLGL